MSRIYTNKLYCYNDITLIPNKLSDINHRSEVNPYTEEGFLPIFAAPMTSVVSKENFSFYESNNIIPILPRNYSIDDRIEYSINNRWAAYSLTEFEKVWCDKNNMIKSDDACKVLIDIANGHMKKLYALSKICKDIYGDKIILMIGNIANPETYEVAAKCGIDYVRCGIGGGDCCITTPITGIGYPMASLISEINEVKEHIIFRNPHAKLPKIIADGGIRGTDDVIKALALGADYVMIGTLFGKKIESASPCNIFTQEGSVEYNGLSLLTDENFNIVGKGGNFTYENKPIRIMKMVFGMASEKGQEAIGSTKKVEEGLVKMIPCDGTIEEWVQKMTHALTSAMSYLNCKTLSAIPTNAEVHVISNNSFFAVNRL